MINLYTTGCPKCKILEMKLNQKHIKFNEISDMGKLKEKNILSVPVMEIDGNIFDFATSVKLVNSYSENQSSFENSVLSNRGEDYGYRF